MSDARNPQASAGPLDAEQLAQLLRSAPDAFVVTDQDGAIVFANDRCEELFGWPPGELLGQRIEILVPERFRAKHVLQRRDYTKDPVVRPMGVGMDLFALHRNGDEVPVEISLSPIHSGGGLLVASAIRDVSERRDAERLFRELLDSAPDAMVIIDDAGLIVRVNRQAEQMFGWSREEMVGQKVEMLVPAGMRHRHSSHRHDFVGKPHTRSMGPGRELVALRSDGKELQVEISLSPLHAKGRLLVSSAIRDITARRLVQEQLKKANDRLEQRVRERTAELQSIFQTAGVAILILSPDGRVMEWNPEAERVYGWRREEVLGHDYARELLPENARSSVQEEITKVLAGHPSRGYENPVRCRDGSLRDMLWNAARMEDQDGSPLGIVACGQDITEYKKTQKKLREEEGLARLGTMAAIVAHEIKNPLAGIAGAVQMLQAKLPPENPDREVFTMIQERIQVLTATLQDLLGYARPPRLQPEALPIRDALEGLVELFEQAEYVRGVVVSIKGPEVPVRFDAQQLAPVFLNLLNNAAEAMDGQGNIEILVARDGDAGECLIKVGDDGPGIPEDQRESVLEPFVTTKSKGTGLGLPTAKRLVEAHGGSLELSFPRDGGTLVSVRLPLA